MSTGPIEDPEAVREAYEDVRSDASETKWCLLKYDGKAIKYDSKGSNVEEACQMISGLDDERAYAYLRFETGDEMSRRAKFAFVCWIGARVSPLDKAKCSTDKPFVKNIFTSFGVEVFADNADDMDCNKILGRLEKASGACYGTGK